MMVANPLDPYAVPMPSIAPTTASAPAARRRGRGPFGAYTEARTWLRVMHLAVGLVLGSLFFSLTLAFTVTSIALIPVFFVAVPFFTFTFAMTRTFGAIERARLRAFLGIEITSPHERTSGSWWARWQQRLRASATWREIGYLLLSFLLTTIGFAVVFALSAGCLAVLPLPLYARLLPGHAAHFWLFSVGPGLVAWGAVAAAVVGLIIAPGWHSAGWHSAGRPWTQGSVAGSSVIGQRLPWFIGAVLIVSFLLLMATFRSILVPLKAVIMNLLSIGAAYGVMVAVFQWGWGGSFLGVGSGAPIEAWAPMLLFAIVFGLSMDYEVFLLTNIREHYDRTGDNSVAVTEGLASTARVISTAAAIMVCVFGLFVFGDLRSIKLIGLGLAVAVGVDATLVRMVLVPATMELLGERNWWFPSWIDRVVPRLSIERAHADA